jgi:hypothetical protein
MSSPLYHHLIPATDKSPLIGLLHDHNPYTYVEELSQLPCFQDIFARWEDLSSQPFVGITTDGKIIPNLAALRQNNAPTHAILTAVNHLLNKLNPPERANICYLIDTRERRLWNNTGLYLHPIGLCLEEVTMPIRQAILAVIRASLSAQGFEKIRDVMRLNAFLGDLLGEPQILGEWSYRFSLFGTPSSIEPWGWNLFGHHLALNCLVLGEQMVLSPTFMGAEPAFADTGPFAGKRLFRDEIHLGLRLMQSLSPELQQQAQIYEQMVDPAMPKGRLHTTDQRQLGGAFQDNRIIPYEGVSVAEFTLKQRRQLLDLIATFLIPLPDGPLSARLEEIERLFDDTYFCWIGPYEEEKPFYYRIQSPVVMIEYDDHSGVYLANKEPEKFHIHTIVRTPNGNDYGMDLLRLHYEQSHHGQQPGSSQLG